MRPKTFIRKHAKGQDDHVDAWLMSYADLITLLFMLFAIFVSASVAKHGHPSLARGEPEHPYLQARSGTLALGTRFDEAYRTLAGTVTSFSADQYIAVEKIDRGITIDMSSLRFFARGSADIPTEQLPVLRALAQGLKNNLQDGDTIEVEGYTADEPVRNSPFANNWELSAMRAARITAVLIAEGVDPARLHTLSYADNHPLVPNVDARGNAIPDNRNRNQRVVIRVQSAKNS